MNTQHWCGNRFTPTFINKLLSWLFNYQCMLHDGDYTAKKNRFLADFIFLLRMLWAICVTFVKLILMIIAAPIMFLTVLLFGKGSWG